MRSEKTKILDVVTCNINEAKVNLANQIIFITLPYIKNDIKNKISDLRKILSSIKSKKQIINEEKIKLETLLKIYNRKKKIKLLLDRALRLTVIESILKDKKITNELIIMLKEIDNLPEEKLDFYISEMMRIVTRRFSKMET